MLIKVLAENTSLSDKFDNEHGLSLYIETGKHKILFDTGASDLFYRNAKKLDVDIRDADYLIISHGHYDHGGGLGTFLKANNKAKIYIKEGAFDEFFSIKNDEEVEYIGLDRKLKDSKQISFTRANLDIEPSIKLFTNEYHKYPRPLSNKTLLAYENNQLVEDKFEHEQNLIIEEDGKTFLITGCAHNGLINIIEQFYLLEGKMPDYVIGGFHLSSSGGLGESKENIEKMSKYLLDTNSKYYTGHCTGEDGYKELKKIMANNIEYIACGSQIII